MANLKNSGYRSIIAALLALVVGGIFIWIGEAAAPTEWYGILLKAIGSFVIASIAMALIFQHWQLGGLVQDLMRLAGVTEQIKASQIEGFSVSFYDNVPWGDIFSESTRLHILFAYAATWRNRHRQDLLDLAARDGSEISVVLPNPDNTEVVSSLARRFGMNPERLRENIIEAADFFRDDIATATAGKVNVYYMNAEPHFTFYRFNHRAVFASYRHRPSRGPVLTLVARRGGEFYEWIRDEWYGLTREAVESDLVTLSFSSTTDRDDQ